MRFSIMALPLLLLGCTSTTMKTTTATPDENLWLEDVQGADAMKWVTERNQESQSVLTKLPGFDQNLKAANEILLAEDRLPHVSFRKGYLYNFWQDSKHVRGIIRRTTVESYKQKQPHWETILDIDALAAAEKEDWVFHGADWLGPDYTRGLFFLSRGGLDASVTREFDLKTRKFVTDHPFVVPQAKSRVAWVDHDTLLVSTDFGPGSMTKSGYPRQVRLWKRGQPLSEAKILLEGTPDDMVVEGFTVFRPEGARTFVVHALNFFEDEVYELKKDGQLAKVDKPTSARFTDWFKGHIILTLRKPWKEYKGGSVVSLNEDGKTQLIFEPNAHQSVGDLDSVKDALIMTYLDSIEGRIAKVTLKNGAWQVTDLAIPPNGDASISSVDNYGDMVVLNYQSFLIPPSIMALHTAASSPKAETWKQLPARFDSSKYQVEQLWSTSKDGTKVPYFYIHRHDAVADGKQAVLILGYGGFEASLSPSYLALSGKLWLEKGGSYVVANIRGGGEFGPAWHEAALKENRQRAFDDFESIAEDLITRKISNPQKIAIQGRSNGGLLVGTAYTQRPDLYRAVICGVPLLDMLRYNKLLAGASWEAEYGNPDDPKMRDAILKYSPYQNLHADRKYPEVFFYTSTTDDRVHPGHARKMVARMKAQGHPFLYFENTVGGHAGSADPQQESRIQTMIYTFLQNRLL